MAMSNDLLIKQRSVIEFLAAEGCSAANIHARMKTVYGQGHAGSDYEVTSGMTRLGRRESSVLIQPPKKEDSETLCLMLARLSNIFAAPTPGLPARHGAQPGDTLHGTPALCQGYPGAILPAEGGTSTGIDPSPIQRKMTSRLGSVGQRCPPVSGEGSGQGGMLMSDSHYCRAVTTSTSRIHPSPHTGRTSR
ncbi:hypothetical protein PoB_003676900 [Plakobranchus ocellatus]|uniref:Mos1 transposase HTH domain-containing protein n=1 Tax=Plakobranchus ocellatus TaxID=259542 RepID=A0AAV4AR32_9GAST|nr:hypothetical protein PoB_003676900 [Plakobranchus ocellatus]